NHRKIPAMEAADVGRQRQQASSGRDGRSVGQRPQLEAVDMDLFRRTATGDLAGQTHIQHIQEELDGGADLSPVELIACGEEVVLQELVAGEWLKHATRLLG